VRLRIRIHNALFASFLGVVALVMLLAVLFAGSGFRDEMMARVRSELGRELGLVGELLSERDLSAPDSLANGLAELVGYRVTLIDSAGVVIGDSEVSLDSLPRVENHADRPEVVLARSGGVGFAERISSTVGGASFLYGARSFATPSGTLVVRIAAPLDQVRAAVGRDRRVMGIAGLLGALAATLVAFFLSRLLSRPLARLSGRAAALAGGDFSTHTTDTSLWITEVRDLSEAFSRLSDELRARLDELGHERDEMQVLIDTMAEGVVALGEDGQLVRVNRSAATLLNIDGGSVGVPPETIVQHEGLLELFESSRSVAVDGREIELLDRALIASARPLESGGAVVTFLDVSEVRRLERVRRDFVANASHEIKTPLTAIMGFAETLMDDELPRALRDQFLNAVQKNTLRLQRLVDDLLDLSKLESGAWQVRGELLSVGPLAQEVWEEMVSMGTGGLSEGASGVSLKVTGEGKAWVDPHSLDQIFRNLFSNSIRHLDGGKRVRVEIRSDDRSVTVAVSDDGSGIDAEDLPRVFERFYRADPARSRDAGGTGLGLSIVRHLVTAMGGEVSAESAPGEGTTVRFTLLVSPPK
jgi:two-component system, OmpR family, phosphate regulon sensor histidine kinase PhoR